MLPESTIRNIAVEFRDEISIITGLMNIRDLRLKSTFKITLLAQNSTLLNLSVRYHHEIWHTVLEVTSGNMYKISR